MLDGVREAITARAVNERGHVDIVSLHLEPHPGRGDAIHTPRSFEMQRASTG